MDIVWIDMDVVFSVNESDLPLPKSQIKKIHLHLYAQFLVSNISKP